MKETILKVIKSRTIMTLVLLLAINIFSTIEKNFPSVALTIINSSLAITAAYFKINPSQKY